MQALREDELEIVTEDGTVLRKQILFTANYGKKDVVFFKDFSGDEEVNVMFYDEQGNLTPLEEEDYTWAEEVLAEWIKDNEDNED